MKWHKSFEEQGKECESAGNRFIIEAPYLPLSVIACVPFKTYCHSRACRDIRTGNIVDINAPAYALSGNCCHVHSV